MADKKEVKGNAEGNLVAFFTNPDTNKSDTAYTVRYEEGGQTVVKTICSKAAFEAALKVSDSYKDSNVVPEFHPFVDELMRNKLIVRAG